MTDARRPIAARNYRLSRRVAKQLADFGVSPNATSIFSVVFAAGAGAAFFMATGSGRWLWLVGAVLVLLRLLANMFDGMVAVEHGKAGPLGDLYNEIPDRLADSVILICIGYSTPDAQAWGYLAALAAMLTAYIRVLGRANGSPAFFGGVMAKQQRMFLIIAFALLASIFPELPETKFIGVPSIGWLLLVITFGGLHTCMARAQRIAKFLRERGLSHG